MKVSRLLAVSASLSFGFLLVGCGRGDASTIARAQNLSGENWIIVTKGATWSPKPAQVLAAREAVHTYLGSLQKTLPKDDYRCRKITEILANWALYKMQAIGVPGPGQVRMHLNFLGLSDETWKRNEIVRVMDGGSQFWNVDFDLNTNLASNLEINGDA